MRAEFMTLYGILDPPKRSRLHAWAVVNHPVDRSKAYSSLTSNIAKGFGVRGGEFSHWLEMVKSGA
jgi:hypothetical protein